MQLVRRRMLTLRVVSPDQSTRFNPDESTSNPPLWSPRDSKQFDRCPQGISRDTGEADTPNLFLLSFAACIGL
jgi:hypothetical protein